MWADRDYLGFVESIEPNLGGQMFEGPHDEPLPDGWKIKTPFTRLRLGGVSLAAFREIMPRVTPLQGPGRDPAERARRLNELREVLRPERLPLIDIHLPSWVPLTSQVLDIARLGGWYSVSVQAHLERRMAPVFFGDPEVGTIDRRFLAAFDVAPQELAVRLRDIFSLAHVGDWGPDGGAGGTPITPPPQPPDGDDVPILCVPWTPGEPVETTLGVMNRFQRPKTEVQEQHIRVGM